MSSFNIKYCFFKMLINSILKSFISIKIINIVSMNLIDEYEVVNGG